MEPSQLQKDKDYNNVVRIAKAMLSMKNRYVILDTETTGLGNGDVVIQLGIIDLNGNVIFDSLIRPSRRKRMSSEATNIHGITMDDLYNAPTLKEIWPRVSKLIGGRRLLIYNGAFDVRLIEQTCNQDRFDPGGFNIRCLMLMYASYVGDWNDYHDNYRYQKLLGGDHTAIGDCKAALKVLEEMGSSELKDVPKQWWEFWK